MPTIFLRNTARGVNQMPKSDLWDLGFFVEVDNSFNWHNHKSETHFHHTYEIYYLTDNTLDYFIEKRLYNIPPKTLVIIPPDTIHTTKKINDLPRKRFLINLPKSHINDIFENDLSLIKKLPTEPITLNSKDAEYIEFLFERLVKEYNRSDQSPIVIKSLIGILLVTIIRFADSYKKETDHRIANNTTIRVLDIVNYINKNYQENITLESLSEHFSYNPYYISRLFKKHLSISFSDHLQNVRIRMACKLLSDTDMKILEISAKVGFSSSSDMCRTFKRIMNVTPLQFRRNMQKISSFNSDTSAQDSDTV